MAADQIFTNETADCNLQWLASLPPAGIIPTRMEIGGGAILRKEYHYERKREILPPPVAGEK